SDDGSLLYIDNELVVNNDGDHSNQTKNGMALLQQGWHGVKLVYFNSGGAANLKVRHGTVGSTLQEFLPAQLAH
ncbi:MAG TPA: PA14 domain-containing protein, partial [Saprospiraceae bacterium]|nr:PA14 domain-containing protein [Saprospiraceae bacterium]